MHASEIIRDLLRWVKEVEEDQRSGLVEGIYESPGTWETVQASIKQAQEWLDAYERGEEQLD